MLEEIGFKFGIPTFTIRVSFVKEAETGSRDHSESTLPNQYIQSGSFSL